MVTSWDRQLPSRPYFKYQTAYFPYNMQSSRSHTIGGNQRLAANTFRGGYSAMKLQRRKASRREVQQIRWVIALWHPCQSKILRIGGVRQFNAAVARWRSVRIALTFDRPSTPRACWLLASRFSSSHFLLFLVCSSFDVPSPICLKTTPLAGCSCSQRCSRCLTTSTLSTCVDPLFQPAPRHRAFF
jgi:hypothetical protein